MVIKMTAFDRAWEVVKFDGELRPHRYGRRVKDGCTHCDEPMNTGEDRSGNESYEDSKTGNAFCKPCYRYRGNYP